MLEGYFMPHKIRHPTQDKVFWAVPLLRPKPLFEFTMEFGQINPEVLHMLIGCIREWPHEGIECCLGHIILGEE